MTVALRYLTWDLLLTIVVINLSSRIYYKITVPVDLNLLPYGFGESVGSLCGLVDLDHPCHTKYNSVALGPRTCSLSC